jgi:hypothetical protein
VTDFLRLIVDVAAFLWPFRIVWQWERGAYYFFGFYLFEVGTGLWPVVPFFCDVKTVNAVVDVLSTDEQTIEVQGGGTLTFTASAKLRVVDSHLALNNVVDHEQNVIEDVAAVLADTLADMPAERLSDDKRRSLLRKCVIEVNKEVATYGMVIDSLRFTNFIRNIGTHRLFTSGITVGAQ